MNFKSQLLTELCKCLNIDKSMSSIYHPIGNGQVERQNHTIIQILKCFVDENSKDWPSHLEQVLYAYNTCPNGQDFSPFEAFFGHKAQALFDPDFQVPKRKLKTYVEEIKTAQDRINNTITSAQKKAKATQKRAYDRNLNDKAKFKVGDLVLIKNDQSNPKANSKFKKPFVGPFKIVQVLNELNYKVDMANGQVKTIHYNRLHEYRTNDRENVPMAQGAKRGRPPNAKKAAPDARAQQQPHPHPQPKRQQPKRQQPTRSMSTRASSRVVKATTESLLVTIDQPKTLVSSMNRHAQRRGRTID